MNRRSFIKKGVGVTLFSGLFSSVFISCYGKDPVKPDPKPGDISVTFSGEQHHAGITLTAKHIEDGTAAKYFTTGSNHTHTFDITTQHITDIKAGSTITVTSTSIKDHAHILTIKLIPTE